MPRVYSLCRTVYKDPSAIQGITTLYMDRTKNVCGQWMREQTRTPPTEIKLFEIIKALKGTWILAKQLYVDLQFEVSSLHVDCVGFEDDPQQQVLLSLADPKRIGQNRKSIWVAGMKRWICSFHLSAGTLYKTSPNPGTWYPFFLIRFGMDCTRSSRSGRMTGPRVFQIFTRGWIHSLSMHRWLAGEFFRRSKNRMKILMRSTL